jgi:hypothetical protein
MSTVSLSVRETRLFQWLVACKVVFRSRLHMTRIENSVGVGASDVEGVLDGKAFYIELKTGARPALPGTRIKVKVEDSQPRWHKKRCDAGAVTYFLIQIGSGRDAARYLIHSEHMLELKIHGMTEGRMRELAKLPWDAKAHEIVERATAASA